MSLYVWNNIDDVALYLGLERLDGETNDEFVNRIKQFARWKYKTDYYTQVHSIPLQLGLNTEVAGRIIGNGNKFNCNIDWDYFTLYEVLPDQTIGEFIRVFIGAETDKLSKIVNAVNSSNNFTLEIYDSLDLNLDLSFLVRNKNVIVANTNVQGKYSYLSNADIVKGSIRVDNPAYRKEVYSVNDLKRNGEFYVDYELGYIQTYSLTPSQANIYYSYYDKTFALEKTELNLLPVNRSFSYGMSDSNIALIPDLLNNLVSTI